MKLLCYKINPKGSLYVLILLREDDLMGNIVFNLYKFSH